MKTTINTGDDFIDPLSHSVWTVIDILPGGRVDLFCKDEFRFIRKRIKDIKKWKTVKEMRLLIKEELVLSLTNPMTRKYPCQQVYGGHPDHIKQSQIDWDTGLCSHEECKPCNYEDDVDTALDRLAGKEE